MFSGLLYFSRDFEKYCSDDTCTKISCNVFLFIYRGYLSHFGKSH